MIKLEVTPYIAAKILRSDIVESLQYDGIAAVIEYYDNIGEDFDFDQSLFWSFHRYESARAAVMDLDSSEVDAIVRDIEEENPDEEISQDDIESECEHWLTENTICLRLDNNEVVVYTAF